jgi:hypothetical protein
MSMTHLVAAGTLSNLGRGVTECIQAKRQAGITLVAEEQLRRRDALIGAWRTTADRLQRLSGG